MATDFPGFLNLSREEANKTLQEYKQQDGKFLIRPSTGNSLYTISVVSGGNIMKYPVQANKTTGHYYVNQARQFPTMNDLINHYRKESISNNSVVLLKEPINGWPRGTRDGATSTGNQPTMPSPVPGRHPTMPSPTAGRHSSMPSPAAGRQPNLVKGGDQLPSKGPKKEKTLSLTTPINGAAVIHWDLPRDMVAKVFEPYMGKNGCFLIRPSSTSDGKLTLCVSYNGSIVNFKISKDSKTNTYRITTKSFPSLEALVSAYQKHPIKSKTKQQEIYLTESIPVSAYNEVTASPPAGEGVVFKEKVVHT
jgi:hypothetical protein